MELFVFCGIFLGWYTKLIHIGRGYMIRTYNYIIIHASKRGIKSALINFERKRVYVSHITKDISAEDQSEVE